MIQFLIVFQSNLIRFPCSSPRLSVFSSAVVLNLWVVTMRKHTFRMVLGTHSHKLVSVATSYVLILLWSRVSVPRTTSTMCFPVVTAHSLDLPPSLWLLCFISVFSPCLCLCLFFHLAFSFLLPWDKRLRSDVWTDRPLLEVVVKSRCPTHCCCPCCCCCYCCCVSRGSGERLFLGSQEKRKDYINVSVKGQSSVCCIWNGEPKCMGKTFTRQKSIQTF